MYATPDENTRTNYPKHILDVRDKYGQQQHHSQEEEGGQDMGHPGEGPPATEQHHHSLTSLEENQSRVRAQNADGTANW